MYCAAAHIAQTVAANAGACNFQVHKAERDAYADWWKAKRPVSTTPLTHGQDAAAANSSASPSPLSAEVADSNEVTVQAMSGPDSKALTDPADSEHTGSNSNSNNSSVVGSSIHSLSVGIDEPQAVAGDDWADSVIRGSAGTLSDEADLAAVAAAVPGDASASEASTETTEDFALEGTVDGQAGSADSGLLLKRWLLATVGMKSQELLAQGHVMVDTSTSAAFDDGGSGEEGFDDQNPGITVDLKALSDTSEFATKSARYSYSTGRTQTD
jgi:hypothetical protein